MIVPMKRLTLMCVASDRESMLETLREEGIVHLSPLQPPRGRDLEKARARLDAIRRALGVLPPAASGAGNVASMGRDAPPEDLVENILGLRGEIELLDAQVESLRRERERLLPLGDFDPESLGRLREKGIVLRVYVVDPRESISPPEGAAVCEIGQDRSGRYLAVIGREKFDLEGREFVIPEESPTSIEQRIREAERERAALDLRLRSFAAIRREMEDLARRTEDRVRFLEARAGMAGSGEICVLQGYCPVDSVERIHRSARNRGWGLLADDPDPGEEVPTLVRYPRWVRPIRAVFDFIRVLPGYREVDISTWFLLFLSLFFALIVGDAGYGAVFLILTVIGRRIVKNAPPSLWALSSIMSVATIVWGVLVGNYFGIVVLPTALRDLRIEWLGDERNLMGLCFLIGAVHLTIAHVWNALRLMGTLRAFAQIGWIGTTWTMFFAARSLVLGEPFPELMYRVFLISVVLIALFMTPLRSLGAQWSEHARLPLSLVSNFVDLVSYVRLFAVGVATLALASAFNEMGMAVASGGIASRIAGALILFAGHTLNILLALLGVLVHGIRLNTLEFSGHLGLEWKGVAYRPFART